MPLNEEKLLSYILLLLLFQIVLIEYSVRSRPHYRHEIGLQTPFKLHWAHHRLLIGRKNCTNHIHERDSLSAHLSCHVSCLGFDIVSLYWHMFSLSFTLPPVFSFVHFCLSSLIERWYTALHLCFPLCVLRSTPHDFMYCRLVRRKTNALWQSIFLTSAMAWRGLQQLCVFTLTPALFSNCDK